MQCPSLKYWPVCDGSFVWRSCQNLFLCPSFHLGGFLRMFSVCLPLQRQRGTVRLYLHTFTWTHIGSLALVLHGENLGRKRKPELLICCHQKKCKWKCKIGESEFNEQLSEQLWCLSSSCWKSCMSEVAKIKGKKKHFATTQKEKRDSVK